MTDLATALLTSYDKLSDFEGLPVRQAAIEIPGAAGGLREAMRIDPQEFRKGDKVFVVLECEVGKIRFDSIDKKAPEGDQRRVHVFDVEGATIVDESLVRRQLDEQREKVLKAKEAAKGVARLNFDEDESEQDRSWRAEHEAGEHQSLQDGCPLCDDELAAEEAERR